MSSLGKHLKRLRKDHNLTLRELGDGVELSIPYLSDLERGRSKPSIKTVEKLADYYNLSSVEILIGNEELLSALLAQVRVYLEVADPVVRYRSGNGYQCLECCATEVDKHNIQHFSDCEWHKLDMLYKQYIESR